MWRRLLRRQESGAGVVARDRGLRIGEGVSLGVQRQRPAAGSTAAAFVLSRTSPTFLRRCPAESEPGAEHRAIDEVAPPRLSVNVVGVSPNRMLGLWLLSQRAPAASAPTGNATSQHEEPVRRPHSMTS